MIVDTSALIAILFREPEAAAFAQVIFEADRCLLSAGNLLELSIVIERQGDDEARQRGEFFLRRAGIRIEPFTEEQADLAQQAFRDFGKGRHRAGLNFGDCFAYALSKATGEPLLFKGRDFRETDILAAL